MQARYEPAFDCEDVGAVFLGSAQKALRTCPCWLVGVGSCLECFFVREYLGDLLVASVFDRDDVACAREARDGRPSDGREESVYLRVHDLREHVGPCCPESVVLRQSRVDPASDGDGHRCIALPFERTAYRAQFRAE